MRLRGCFFFSPQRRKERNAEAKRTLRLFFFHSKGAKGAKPNLCELCVSAVIFYSPQSRKVAKNAKPNLCELCISAVNTFSPQSRKERKAEAKRTPRLFFFTAKSQRTQSQTSANSASPRLFFFTAKARRTQSKEHKAKPLRTLRLHGCFFYRKGAKNAKDIL